MVKSPERLGREGDRGDGGKFAAKLARRVKGDRISCFLPEGGALLRKVLGMTIVN